MSEDTCRKIVESIVKEKYREKILRDMLYAIKNFQIDIDEKSLKDYALQKYFYLVNTHTYSINQCPRFLSSAMKRIADKRVIIPSFLVIKILRDWIKENEPEVYERMEKVENALWEEVK